MFSGLDEFSFFEGYHISKVRWKGGDANLGKFSNSKKLNFIFVGGNRDGVNI